jgi:dolichol-phosphate mannosyltransferase
MAHPAPTDRPEGDDADARALEPVPAGPLRIGPIEAAVAPIRLSLIIPTYNERENIEELVHKLSALLDEPLGEAYELIVVDDDSPDRTWQEALALRARYPRVRVLRRTGERCLATAVIRGWQAARGEVLGVIDADLQHPPEITRALWDAIQRGADLAVGSRHVEGGGVSDWAFSRRVLSRGAQALGLVILPRVVARVSDPMSGYFMVRRRALEGVTMDPLGYKILVEVLGRGTIGTIAEVGYVFRERSEGESKVTRRIYLDYVRHLVRLALSRPR